MRTFKIFLLAILSLNLLTTCAEAQNGKNKNSPQTDTKQTTKTNDKPMDEKNVSNFKILAEGGYSKVESPFVFVARSKETYALLRGLVENLPAESEIDFDKQAVIAAFAGTRRTGGYSVEIKNISAVVNIEVASPPKDAMVTQALTQPFKVALVPVETEKALLLSLSSNWTKAMHTYKVNSGDFEYSGGFAGRRKQFAAEGTIGALTFGDLITLDFNLSGKGTNKNMKLAETASGTIKDGKINLARLDAGSFSEGPRPPDKVWGTIANEKLSLNFEPLPTYVSDGFSLRGRLEAVKSN